MCLTHIAQPYLRFLLQFYLVTQLIVNTVTQATIGLISFGHEYICFIFSP